MADNPDKSLPTEGKSGSNQDIVLPSMSSAEDIVNRAREEIEKTMENAMANQQGGQEFEEIVEYIDPIQDPYGKAIKYLEQHDILQLFQVISTNFQETKYSYSFKCDKIFAISSENIIQLRSSKINY